MSGGVSIEAAPTFQRGGICAGADDGESGIREDDFECVARFPPGHLEFGIAAETIPMPNRA